MIRLSLGTIRQQETARDLASFTFPDRQVVKPRGDGSISGALCTVPNLSLTSKVGASVDQQEPYVAWRLLPTQW